MNLKVKRKKMKRPLSLRSFYSEMIKLFGGPWLGLYLRPKVYRISENVPKRIKGGVLIASNHRSMLDPLILFCVFWYRRLYFPAAGELFEKSINRFFFYNMNCIEIDRNAPNTKAVRAMCGLLRKGRAIAIFPEGRINTSEKLVVDYKKGTVYMAKRTGCPVLPVYIAERETRHGCANIVIGEPIDIAALCREYPKAEALAEASKRLRQAELELAEYYSINIKQCTECEVEYV